MDIERRFHDLRREETTLNQLRKTFGGGLFCGALWYYLLPAKRSVIDKKLKSMVLGHSKEKIPQTREEKKPPQKKMETERMIDWKIHLQEIKECQKCPRHYLKKGTKPLHLYASSYPTQLKILFLFDYFKEKPMDEDLLSEEQRVIFNGMISAFGLSDQEYTLSSVIKCFAEKEDVIEEMKENCSSHIEWEICSLKPQVIVSLGAFATNFLLKRKERLSVIHGKFIKKTFEGHSGFHESVIVPLFHLDYMIINPKIKKTVWPDMQNIIKYLKEQEMALEQKKREG